METAKKRRQALEMRLESKSYRDIADAIGVAIPTARLYVREGIQAYLPEEQLEDLRAMEVGKIDTDEEHAVLCIRMLLTQAQRRQADQQNIDGELEGIRKWKDTLMNLRKQRALLLGLNKPVQVLHAHKIRTEYDEEIESLVAELSGGGKLLSNPDEVLSE